jgi:hypothetical protein
MWDMFLQVAEGVRAGKRLKHQAAIAEKKDFYEWMQGRTGVLLQKAAALNPLVLSSRVENEEQDLQASQEFIAYLQS